MPPPSTADLLPDRPHAGKVALVTGAAQGIGRSIARRFAREGAAVVAVDQDRDGLEVLSEELGGSVRVAVADLSGEPECARVARIGVDEFGRLDILSANAGIAVPRPFLAMSESHLSAHLAVNVIGTAMTAMHAAHWMRESATGGAIVIMSSINGVHVEESMTAYNVSKGALLSLVRSAAIDLMPMGIRVNGVAPGVVDTRLAAPVLDHPETRRRYLETIPAERFADVEDIGSVVSWLASDASSYVVGQTITVDGGQTLGIRGQLTGPAAVGTA